MIRLALTLAAALWFGAHAGVYVFEAHNLDRFRPQETRP